MLVIDTGFPVGVSPLLLGVGDRWENHKNNYHKSINIR